MWTVKNFKGLREAEIDLASGKLTVLAGVNSSGKSSIIQSLLLMAQSQYHRGPLVLNGPLTRLGTASDLVRDAEGVNEVEFALDFDLRARPPIPHLATFTLGPSKDDSTLRLRELVIESRSSAARVRLHDSYVRSADLDTIGSAVGGAVTDILPLKSPYVGEKRKLRTYVTFSGVAPSELIQVRPAGDVRAAYVRLVSPVLDRLENSLGSAEGVDSTHVVEEFLRLLYKSYQENGEEAPEPIRAYVGPNSAASSFLFYRVWNTLSTQDRQLLVARAADSRAKSTLTRVAIARPSGSHIRRLAPAGALERVLRQDLQQSLSVLRALAEAISDMGERIQYLGPLRDEPRVLWSQWNELARGLPVGTRGEHSAVVLSRAARRVVGFATPDGDQVRATLATAVDIWLKYLQIGDRVHSLDSGKLGIELRVHLNGLPRDLTSVGVGVSQALPLVIGMLSAPLDSVFIIEQPELHLHPAVQSRLADFLLKARRDLSVIVETHSEALVTRIRRRIAEDDISANRAVVVFVENDADGAFTRPLTFDEHGDLDKWPADFLLGVGEDTAAIVRANLKRLQGGTFS
jgi:ABC-type ATPase involved in cell division